MWWTMAALAAPVEFPAGRTLASMRIRGMGGACLGLAESASCHLLQPASVAIRRPGDREAISFDTTLQARVHPVLSTAVGWLGVARPPAPYEAAAAQVAANMKVGSFAVGGHLKQEGWVGDDGPRTANTWLAPSGVAHGAWSVGVSPILTTYHTPSGSSAGAGGHGGVLFAPDGSLWRLGARGRTAVRTPDRSGSPGFSLPWQAAVGASWSPGLRNEATPFGPHRATEWAGGDFVMLAADVALTGPTDGAIALLPSLSGVAVRGVERPTASVHLGGEAGVLADRWRVRAGAYSVPARFDAERTALRAALGLTTQIAKDFAGQRWRAGVTADLGPPGSSVGVGVETW